LGLNEPDANAPSANITVNPTDRVTGDPDPLFPEIPFSRNEIVSGTGTDINNPAEHSNKITAYLDASMVYGSSETVANQLRTFNNGKLKSQIINGEELLVFASEVDVPVANPLMLPRNQLFVAGDARVNEQTGLTAIHTVMVREHNRIAEDLKARLDSGEEDLVTAFINSGLNDEDQFIYQSARKLVGAQVQIITYNEFLPLLLGENPLPESQEYDNSINAGITEEFANAAFRFGHTTLPPDLLRMDDNFNVLETLSLADTFFNTTNVIDNGIDSLLKGLSSRKAQEFDPFLVDEVRNFLFPAASGGSDLASVNIARGRDVGLGSLNEVRSALGLTPYGTFADINPDPLIIDRLSTIYGSVDDIDLWVGGLAETPFYEDALLGETFGKIIKNQFTRLRDGDRFFYLYELEDLRLLDPNIESVTLSQLLNRNSEGITIQSDGFRYVGVPEPSSVFSLLGLGLLGIAKLWRQSNE
jgi:hypothetical protein